MRPRQLVRRVHGRGHQRGDAEPGEAEDEDGERHGDKRLQRASRFAESNTPSYLRDHPVTYERIAEAKTRAQDLPYKQVRDSLDFLLSSAGFNVRLFDSAQAFLHELANLERNFFH